MKLHVIVVSTRPGRVGLPIASWFLERAKAHGGFDVDLVDLKEVGLPLLDEAKHPRLRQYEHEHTRRWSASVDAADAFVFVTPEYNFSAPAALVNALDCLFHEWAYKPAGFVSYGGMSGGIRSVQAAKQLMTSFKLVPIPEAVALSFFANQMKDGAFAGTEAQDKSSVAMLDELVRWARALKPMRG